MNEYTVKVKQQGNIIETVHGIVAANAKAAIAFVEEMMGDRQPEVRIDVSTGAMCVFGWSGREYVARRVTG